jgi:rSAM/selenodomain-associated transferase 2
VQQKISFIIPVFNEAKLIRSCLENVFALNEKPDEVIVVDAGSDDETAEIVRQFDCRLLQSPKKGRAYQLDLASRQASGDILVYLHADTLPNPDTIKLVRKALSNPEVVLGAFRSIMKGRSTRNIISFHNRIKSYYAPFFFNPHRTLFKGLRLLFGDQVMFCRKADYLASGGFDLQEEVMEEAAFCLRMNELGRIVQLKEKVYSSDRRVVEWGVWKAHFLYIAICTGWGWGISSKKLAKLYPDVR